MPVIAPSVLSADFSKLGEELDSVKASGAEWIHFDVMDGIFVPNISFGIPVLKCIDKYTDMFLDAHLMITKPVRFVDQFIKAGADSVTVHVEADTEENILAALRRIKAAGAKAGISVKPGTPVSAIEQYLPMVDLVLVMTVEPGFGGQSFMPEQMDKVRLLRKLREENGYTYLIQIDGGVNGETSAVAIEAGVDVLVAGSYFFKATDRAACVLSMRH